MTAVDPRGSHAVSLLTSIVSIAGRVRAHRVLFLCLLLIPTALRAQDLVPKRVLSDTRVAACAAPSAVMQISPDDRQRADALLSAGQQAALVGDQASAQVLFSEAARLDPTNPEIAYHLGRAREDAAERESALQEFCRFLALAPESPDAAEVRQRIAGLTETFAATVTAEITEQFQNALVFYDRGEYLSAEVGFTYITGQNPSVREAYFNRALTRLALQRQSQAIRDLEQYLELAPGAADREQVIERIATLRAATIAPTVALTRGLLVPGLGQYTTRRPALGAAVLGLVGAATYVALRQETVTRADTFPVEFGEPEIVPFTETVRPHLGEGLFVAAAVTLFAAAEAYDYSVRQRRNERVGRSAADAKATPIVQPSSGGLRLGMQIRLSNR